MAFEIRALRLSEVLDESFELCKRTFFLSLPFLLLVYVPCAAVVLLGMPYLGQELSAALGSEDPRAFVPVVISFVGGSLGLFLFQVMGGAAAQLVILEAMQRTYRGRDVNLALLFSYGGRNVLRFVLFGIVVALLVVAVASLPALVVLAPAAYFAVQNGGTAAVAVLVIAGLFTLSLAALSTGYVMVRLSLAAPAMAVEGLGVGACIRRSGELLKGAMGRAVALFFVVLAVQLFIGMVLSVLVPTPSLEGIDPDEVRQMIPRLVESQALGTVVGQVAGMFAFIYATACWLLMYFSRRCETEGFDLEHQAEQHVGA